MRIIKGEEKKRKKQKRKKMKKRTEKQDVKSLNTHSIDAKLCSHRKVTVRNERAARNASGFICVKM